MHNTAVQKAKPGINTAVQKARPGTKHCCIEAKAKTSTAGQKSCLQTILNLESSFTRSKTLSTNQDAPFNHPIAKPVTKIVTQRRNEPRKKPLMMLGNRRRLGFIQISKLTNDKAIT